VFEKLPLVVKTRIDEKAFHGYLPK